MATVLDIIKRAHRISGIYALGETPSPEESADALYALNSMLGSWANESLLIYADQLDSITLIPGVSTYTIGPSGGTITVRPMSISNSSYIRASGIDYPLAIISLDQYNNISSKSEQSEIPEYLWYQDTFPNSTVTLYPVPSVANVLNLWSKKQITGFSTLTEEVSLPPGYQEALEYNLADALAIETESQLTPAASKKAVMLKKMLKRTNLTVPTMALPYPLSYISSNIISG